MEEKNQNAFPRAMECSEGLTKREYFIAAILSGSLELSHGTIISKKEIVQDAVKIADELMKELGYAER